MERELPMPHQEILDQEPQLIENKLTSQSVLMPPDAVAVYDSLMGAAMLLINRDFSFCPEDYAHETYDKCKKWLEYHEPESFAILSDKNFSYGMTIRKIKLKGGVKV
mgnify:CR=1 FL=1